MTKIIGAATLRDALSALAEEIGEREARGERNIVFCEDRLTLLAERAVVGRTGGTFLTEVTTFARFLGGDRRVISKQASVTVVSSLLAAHAGELRCFNRSSAQAVYETIAQLSASRVDTEALREGAAAAEGMLGNKLSDLALILGEYTAFLRGRELLDENGYLALLPDAIASGGLGGANVFFFAFPSFTRQALEGVRAACLYAGSVTGIFPAGKEDLYTNESAHAFRLTAEECGEVTTCMAPCSLRGDALALRSALFSPDAFTRPKQALSSVHIFCAEDDAREMETVCALIKKHVAEDGFRYRDIAVLVPDAESFLTVGKCFSAFRIPYYADRKKPYAEHPFSVFVLDILNAVADGGTGDSVDAVASSLYFGAGGDEYRNYLLRYGGYRGAVNREIRDGDAVKGYDRPSLVLCRERMRGILSLFPRKGKGSEYVAAVRALAERTDAPSVTEELASRCGAEERDFLSLERMDGMLSEFDEIAGGETFTAREFSQSFGGALAAAEISVLPRRTDAVFVGDATESKLSGSRVVFCTGLTDALPRLSHDSAVISDGDIERLSRLRVKVEPAIAVVNARARESLALNLCAFDRALYLSRPLRLRGAETRRSEALDYVERAFDPAPIPALYPYDCCEREPAVLAMLRRREEFLRGRGEREGELFAAVRGALERKGEGELADRLLSGGDKRPVPQLPALLFGGEVSPTLLETYFECPYEGFAMRGLRVREREERSVIDADAGTFVHAVLERVATKFNEYESEEECRAEASSAARELLASPRYSALSDTRAGAYAGERLIEECAEVSAAAYRQLAQSEFRVRETEGEIRLPELSIRGRTDRVDESGDYIRIIDYKTGHIDDASSSYYTGRKLQLQLYLLAASREKKPAGAFYFPAADEFGKEGDEKYRMRGFFSGEDEVLRRMDPARESGKSAFFAGGGRSEHGMPQDEFEDFLRYALLVARGARREMEEGNISPSPYENACTYCKLKGMCSFTGEPRRAGSVNCGQIVSLVRRERGEE